MKGQFPWKRRGVALLCITASAAVGGGCSTPEARRDGRDEQKIGTAIGKVTATTCATLQRGTGALVSDTQIAAGDPTRLAKNYGDSWTGNAGVVAGGDRQFLLRFDLGSVPQGAAIASATLTLHQTNDAAANVRVHRITSPFVESTVSWSSFGGAFDPAVVASFPNGGPGYAGPLDVDLTTLAQGWVNSPSQNHGVLFEQDPVGATRFWTSDDANVAEQPKLTVCWAPATCSDGIQDQGERGVDCGGPCPLDCPHPPATEAVSAGERAKSPHYTAVYTFGQPSQNQEKTTSPSYRVQGGLIGANGSLP